MLLPFIQIISEQVYAMWHGTANETSIFKYLHGWKSKLSSATPEAVERQESTLLIYNSLFDYRRKNIKNSWAGFIILYLLGGRVY